MEEDRDKTLEQDALDDTVVDATRVAQDPTTEMPAAEDAPSVDDASFRDVRVVAGKFARGRLSKIRDFFGAHALATVVACLCLVALIFGAVWYARSLADYPENDLVLQDTRERLAHAEFTPGSYDSQEEFKLSGAEVLGKHKEMSSPDECSCTLVLIYATSSVKCTQSATLEYQHEDGAWHCVSAVRGNELAYEATSGISDGVLLANVSDFLGKAEASFADGSEGGGLSLPTLYRDARVSVTDRNFDAPTQTFDARLHLLRSSDFTAYECDLTVSFAFRAASGKWELTNAQVSRSAKDLQLTPLIGTWEGAFTSQSASAAKCFAAKQRPLSLTITSAEDGHIAGTLSCTAHFHAEPTEDANASQGDEALIELAFTGTIDGASSGISFVCATPEDPRGTISLRLDFGSPEDPTAATATVTTSYAYETTFLFLPIEREARYSDVFMLERR